MVRLFRIKVLIEEDNKYYKGKEVIVNVKKALTGMSTIDPSLICGLKIFQDNGGFYPKKADCPCWWDRHKFDTQPIPIPLRIVFGLKGEILEIYGRGYFYSFENCYAYLKELKMEKEIRNLLKLFKLFYPDKELISASDWRCLKDVGDGTTNITTFRSGHYHIYPTANVYIFQTATKYKTIEKNEI